MPGKRKTQKGGKATKKAALSPAMKAKLFGAFRKQHGGAALTPAVKKMLVSRALDMAGSGQVGGNWFTDAVNWVGDKLKNVKPSSVLNLIPNKRAQDIGKIAGAIGFGRKGVMRGAGAADMHERVTNL